MYKENLFKWFWLISAYTSAIAPNSINLVLETCIRIEPQENINQVLNNVSSLIDKIKYALIPIDKDLVRRAQMPPKKYLTNFLKDTVNTILNLEYDGIEIFFKCLYDEIKYYFSYKGSAFEEIVKNPLVKRHLEDTLKEWSETDAFEIKMNIRDYIDMVNNKDNSLNRLGDFLNNFYDQKDEVKMKKIVNKLKNCTKEDDFAKVITSAIHSFVIKQYDKMNFTIRTRISDEVNRLSELAIKRRFQGDDQGDADVKTTIKVNDNFVTTTNNITLQNVSVTLPDNKNDSNINNTAQTTKMDISTIKEPQLKDVKENIIPVIEKLNVSKDIEKNNSILLQDIDSDKTTKKISTITTTRYIITSKVLKRFKLKHPVVNGTATNTSAPQDINDANGTTAIPQIVNGTTENVIIVPKASENGTLSTTTVKQNMTSTSTALNITASVPLDINNVTGNSYAPRINNQTVPILRVDDQASTVPINIKINSSIITIPVPRIFKTSKMPDLRVFGNRKKKNMSRVKGKMAKNVKGRNNSGRVRKGKRGIKKRTTFYVPPKAKKILAELAYKKKHPLDIEEKVDLMNIDG